MKLFISLISCALLIITTIYPVSSRQVYTTRNGSFNDSLVWSGKQIPCTGDTLIINHDITYDRTVLCNYELVIISKNALLIIDKSAQINLIDIQREGEIRNHGVIEKCSK